jgi:hypothetical protein
MNIPKLETIAHIYIENKLKNKVDLELYERIKNLYNLKKKMELSTLVVRCYKCGQYTYRFYKRFYPIKIFKKYRYLLPPYLVFTKIVYASKWVNLCYCCNDQFDRKMIMARESLKRYTSKEIMMKLNDKNRNLITMYEKWKLYV